MPAAIKPVSHILLFIPNLRHYKSLTPLIYAPQSLLDHTVPLLLLLRSLYSAIRL
jgi:hypothetical protein